MSDNYRVTTVDDLGKYQDIIFGHSISAAATGGTIGALLPGLDTIGVSAIWLSMISQISERSNNYTDEESIKKFLVVVFQGAGSYIVGSTVLRYALLLTGFGAIGSAALNALLNFLYTARLGIFIAEQYDQPGFTMEHALSALVSAGKIVFAVPTADELRFAFKMTQNR
jgi:hypothetical protein